MSPRRPKRVSHKFASWILDSADPIKGGPEYRSSQDQVQKNIRKASQKQGAAVPVRPSTSAGCLCRGPRQMRLPVRNALTVDEFMLDRVRRIPCRLIKVIDVVLDAFEAKLRGLIENNAAAARWSFRPGNCIAQTALSRFGFRTDIVRIHFVSPNKTEELIVERFRRCLIGKTKNLNQGRDCPGMASTVKRIKIQRREVIQNPTALKAINSTIMCD